MIPTGWKCLLLISVLMPKLVWGQEADTASKFTLPVSLDSFVVKSGFDVNAFIRRVRTDTTFYKAFKSMRLIPYTAINNITVLDKTKTVKASLYSLSQQHIDNHCRTTTITEERTTGDFYKSDGEYNYYTARLFAFLFLAKKPVCNERDIVAGGLEMRGEGQMEKSEYQLKQLIFNPGAKVAGIPFMGSRASIFDEQEAVKYDFKITKEMFEGVSCFVFRIAPKAGYEHKVIYNELTTWFRAGDYSIVARDYSLSYNTMVYDFDVTMKVRTTQINKKLYPTSITYDGNWHILTKKRERVKFTVAVSY